MPEGLFIIRLALGLLLFAHGTQKLFGWYGGYGLDGTGGFFESVGHKPGRLMAGIAGASEAGGGLLLVLGLATPLGAAMVTGTMIVAAVSVHAPNGLWATNGGYELPLINALVAVGLGFTGAGTWSADNAFGIPWTRGVGPGLLAVFLAGCASAITLARRQQTGAEQPAAEAYPAETAPADAAAESDQSLNA
jgi:putative oxidoreductase